MCFSICRYWKNIRVTVLFDTGSFFMYQYRSILESVLCTNIGRYWLPVSCLDARIGRYWNVFVYHYRRYWYGFFKPHIHGFSERVPLKHDPTMIRAFINICNGVKRNKYNITKPMIRSVYFFIISL